MRGDLSGLGGTHVRSQVTLEIGHAGGVLRASVTLGSAEPTPLQTWASRTIDLEDIRSQHARMTAVLNRASRFGEMDPGSREVLRQQGRLLFDSLLPAATKETLRSLEGGELTLVLDEGLVFVPWELMHTGRGFIGLDFAVGRVVRTASLVAGGARPTPQGPWRMLVLCDPRGDLMGSYYEGLTLRDELDAASDRLSVDLRSSEVGVGEVRELVREYDVIHYAGHAELHPTRPRDSGWLLSDGVLSAAALLDLAGGPSFPRLVFSNACRSGRVDGPMALSGDGDAIYSVAHAFLLAGVQHYIGTLWDVPDEPACHFALAFYEELVRGTRLGEAIRRSRHALTARYGEDTVLWASYVLYGEPGARATPSAAQHAPPVTPSEHIDLRARPASRPEPVRRGARVRGAPGAGAGHVDAPFESTEGLRPRALRLWPVVAALALAPLALWLLDGALTPRCADPLTFGPYVRTLAPEAFDAPREGLAPPPLVRAAGADADAFGQGSPNSPDLELRLLAQRSPRSEDAAEVSLPQTGGHLRSGDNFRILWQCTRHGHVALWHVESQGAISLVHPAEGDGTAVTSSEWTALPGADRWFFLDERSGPERFVLGWSAGPPPPAEALRGELAGLAKALSAARQHGSAPALAEPLTLRGVGGTRAAVRTGPPRDEAALLRAIDGVFAAHYDRVLIAEFDHQ